MIYIYTIIISKKGAFFNIKNGLKLPCAVDEVVADGCEMMLKDSKALSDFAKEHRNVFEKIVDCVMDFIEKIRSAISSLYKEDGALHDEAVLMGEYADELQEIFDRVLSETLEISSSTVDRSVQSSANKKAASDGGKVQKSKGRRTFTYEELVSKDNLIGKTIKRYQTVPLTKDGGINLEEILKIVRSKCESIQTKSKTPTYFVYVPDIGTHVVITRDGIKHSFFKGINNKDGITDNVLLNARIALELPDILNGAIEVNRSDRDNSQSVAYSSILIGTVRIQRDNSETDYDYYAVRFVVFNKTDGSKILNEANIFGLLKSANAKKIGQHNAKEDTNVTSRTQSDLFEYSISDLLNDVKSEFNDTFSIDVYDHFNMERHNTPGFTKYLQFSRSDNYDPYAEYNYYENRKVYGESLIDALERTVQTQEDKAVIDEYRNVEADVNRKRSELAEINNSINSLLFTPADQAEAAHLSGMREDAKALGREIREIQRDIKKARDAVAVTEHVIKDKSSTESARTSALGRIAGERQALARLERQLSAKQTNLSEKETSISEMRDPRIKALTDLKETAASLRREISAADRSLFDMRSTQRFKTLLARERAQAIKERRRTLGI